MSHENDRVRAVVWRENALELLDQRLLPGAERYRRLTSAAEVADAIREMVVRGAPAIGIAAAYGVVLAASARHAEDPDRWRRLIGEDLALLAAARRVLRWLGRLRNWRGKRSRRTSGISILETPVLSLSRPHRGCFRHFRNHSPSGPNLRLSGSVSTCA
jgi:hypothetical protein